MNPYYFEVDVRDRQKRFNDYICQAKKLRTVRMAQQTYRAVKSTQRSRLPFIRIFTWFLAR